jgi:hypothetical protein
MKRILCVLFACLPLLAAPPRVWASTDTALAAATAAGHPVFLIVTDGGAVGLDAARRVVSDAQKLVPGASILEMNRADAANEAVVGRYRLATVPVPLILVIAPNGVAAGGARPDSVTAERLAGMVPSPAKAAFLKALDEGKATFLVFARSSMPDLPATTKAAEDAAASLKGAAVLVQVDLDSAKEAPFAAEMKQDVKATTPVTIVYNAKGRATETLRGVPTAATLAAAATKIPTSTCKPGECGPGGCK